MAKKILWTTKNDLSACLFDNWQVFFYEDNKKPEFADVVYFRDPFNSEDFVPDPQKINKIISFYSESKSIDNIRSFSDMKNAEDKYLQFQALGEVMPHTYLYSEKEFETGQHLAKLRISQRAKNILFELKNKQLTDDWIIQDLLDIKEEIRVYVVGGQIFETVSIKSSKQSGKVKVIGTRKISSQEKLFIEKAVKKIPSLDFIGFDLAILGDGNFKIIEANRSPQFSKFFQLTGQNPILGLAQEKQVIGANALVEIEGIKNIPAKIDTGADSSSIHATSIAISEAGILSFKIFNKEISTKDFKATIVRNSTGEEQVRYRTPLSLKINNKKIRAMFTLTNRAKNNFPVLIGRRTIKNKFVVDVSYKEITTAKNPVTKKLNQELQKNPFKFHQKYIKSNEEK